MFFAFVVISLTCNAMLSSSRPLLASGEPLGENHLVVASLSSATGNTVSQDPQPQKKESIADAVLNVFEREGRGFRIQGLGHVRTELNGRDIFTVPNGHALSWSDISREWMEGVDTVKTPDASMGEGGLGGIINIRTKKPLSLADDEYLFSVGSTYSDLAGAVTPHVSLLTSQRWHTRTGDWGVLLTGIAGENQYRQDELRLEPFVLRDDLASTPVSVPRGVRWRSSLTSQHQRTLGLGVQWQPNPAFNLSWQTLVASYDRETQESGAGINEASTAIIPANATEFLYDSDGVFRSGQLWSNAWRGDVAGNSVRMNGAGKRALRDDTTQEHTFTLDYSSGRTLAIRADFQWLLAKTKVTDFTVYTSSYLPDFYLEVDGDLPRYQLTDQDYLSTPDNYFWNAAMDHLEDGQARLGSGRLDAIVDMESVSGLDALRFGVLWSQDTSTVLDSGYNWGSLSDNWNLPLQSLSVEQAEYSEFVEPDNFFAGKTAFNPAFYLPKKSFVSDYPSSSRWLEQIKSGDPDAGWGPDAYTFDDKNTLKHMRRALYGMLLFDNPGNRFGKLRGNIGVRVVRSSRVATGYGEFSQLDSDPQNTDPAELAFADGRVYPLQDAHLATHILPSAYMQIDFDPEIRWRVAASRTLNRPDYYQVRSYVDVWAETETRALAGGGSETVVTRWLGKAGNPILNPVRVQQYDTELEWQFSDTGNVYSAVFYKQLADAIERQVVMETHTNRDQQRRVEVEKLVNGGDADIRGVELGWRQRLGFLPGDLRNIAVQTTYTRIDSQSTTRISDRRLPLEGIAENNLSVSGTYQNQFFSTTFNYSWRDDVLLSAVDANTHRPRWQTPQGRLDASLAWPLSNGIQLAVEAKNLTRTINHTEYGAQARVDGSIDTLRHPHTWSLADRHWRFVIRHSY